MVQDEVRSAPLDALRQALYPPGASGSDLSRYERQLSVAKEAAEGSVDAGPVSEELAPTVSRTSRLRVVVGAVAVAGVLIVLGLTTALPQIVPTVNDGTRSSTSAADLQMSARDGGPKTYAQGAASRIEGGQYRYTVAPGDTALGIAARFHVCIADVNAGLPPGADNGALPVGTVISVQLSRWEIRAGGTVACS